MSAATRPLSAVALAVLLSACQGESVTPPASADMGLALPDRLLQSRAVDRTRLRPDVTLSTGQRVAMRRIDGNNWTGTAQVRPGIDLGVEVMWVSRQPQGDLPLARLERVVPIGATGAALEVNGAQYDYAFDSDGDGVLNLAELEAGSDPFPVGTTAPGETGTELPGTGDPDAAPSVDQEPAPGAGPNGPGTVAPDPELPDGRPDRADPDEPGTPTSTPLEDDGDDEVDQGIDENADDDRDDETDDRRPDGLDASVDVDVFVPRIAATRAPDIDGRGVSLNGSGTLTGEWSGAVQVDSGGLPLGIDALMIDEGADAPSGTPWRRWGAVHDGEYLYVVVIVEDDGERFADSALFWEDDGIELFLDGNHSRLTAYGDDDDYHLVVPLLEPGSKAGQKKPNANDVAGWMAGPFSTGQGIELDFMTGPGAGPDGLRRPRFEQDVYELRIALDSIGVSPGEPFGFELQVNDDDDGGSRDSKWGWAHPARADADVDLTFIIPSIMGTMMLD